MVGRGRPDKLIGGAAATPGYMEGGFGGGGGCRYEGAAGGGYSGGGGTVHTHGGGGGGSSYVHSSALVSHGRHSQRRTVGASVTGS
jgi:hypothetical protein